MHKGHVMSIILVGLIVSCSASLAGHEESNPLYREVRNNGIAMGGGFKARLAPPTMPDGLDARAQQAVIEKLGGNDYSLDDLLRNSPLAPQIIRLGDVTPSDPAAPARSVDVWYIAYGGLDILTKKDFLDKLLNSEHKEGQGKILTKEDLAKRQIAVDPANADHDTYGYIDFNLLDKVQISATGHAFWSRTADSVLVAAKLDPRFATDPEFPNTWRPLTKRGGQGLIRGPAQPYDGAGYYVKVTRLANPPGALFVESHVVFAEPTKWFNGANLLGSKLPAVIQHQTRAFRTELKKATE
jgi:hypothetical protein